MNVDAWHYTGSTTFHQSEEGKEFIENFQKKYKQNQQLPIKVGNTGYIDLTAMPNLPTYEWCYDEVGRFVAIIGDILIFQRMLNGHRLMYGKIENIHSAFNNIFTPDLMVLN